VALVRVAPVVCGALMAAEGEQPRTASAAEAERTPARWRPSAPLVRPREPGRATDADWEKAVVVARRGIGTKPEPLRGA
jgi:hypothetical protein